ncbi:TlpA family protein disulfide reductase [Sphingobacterium cavernae]|uniref:TlpA family protein disulfide reductase n=1 Tax=Sphingobacterium cavernae TaxID=2592657 RepID=UPI00123000AE|nr:redoxin domain-containing protein [Sphingobacterium cavernae]
MQNLKKYWKYPILSFVLLIICLSVIPLVRSYYNFHTNIVVSLFSYFIFSYLILKKTLLQKEKNIKSILVLLPFIILVILSFFFQLLDYFPGLVFAPVIGITLGYISDMVNNKFYKFYILIIPILLSVWVFTTFSKIWQDFMIYRTFGTGETLKDAPHFTFYKENVRLSNKNFIGKTSVFFIWNTSCPYTPRYLPSLKLQYEKFSSNEKIKFYSVNIPMSKDTLGTDSLYLSQYGINLTFLKVSKIEDMYEMFGQAPIPLTIILNPEGKIVYWGNIDKIGSTLTKYQ